jgi:hypothetical protein
VNWDNALIAGPDAGTSENLKDLWSTTEPPASETYIMKVQGHDIYQDDNGNVLVLLKTSGNILVPVTNSDGISFTDPTVLPVNTNDWYTPDTEGPAIKITLDVIQEQVVVVDRTPQWSEGIAIDGKPIFQDDNLDSLTSRLVGTDVGNVENSVIVVITDNLGNTFNDPSSVPSLSAQWFTEDPQNQGQYIQIQFGDGGDEYVLPQEALDIADMVGGLYSTVAGQMGGSIPVEMQSSILPQFVTQILNGDGGDIEGLVELTGLAADADIDDDASNGIQTLQDIVSADVQEAVNATLDSNDGRTVDEIFKDAIEDSLVEIESYNPDIFGSGS